MQKAALVLSGGGVRALAHIGALKILDQYYDFDFYAGCSAGSIICAGHALGFSSQKISQIIHAQKFSKFSLDFSGSNFGVLKSKKVFKILEEIFEHKTFNDVKTRGKQLFIYATDFQTGERVEISSGRIDKAVMASICLPIVFEPFYYQDRWLTDGGLSGNFPIHETFAQYTGNKIIGIDISSSIETTKDFSQKKFFGKSSGIKHIFERIFRILFQSQQHFDKNDPRLTLLVPNLNAFTFLDFKKFSDIEQAGEQCAKKILA